MLTIARLEPGDLPEGEAASVLGDSTGRCRPAPFGGCEWQGQSVRRRQWLLRIDTAIITG